MKPTSDDFQPRRDGWFEHRGTWGEVTVGTVLSDQSSRTKRWEIVDCSHGLQVQYGYTLWMRAREQTSGEEFTVRPRPKTDLVDILTRDPADTQTASPTPPSDSEAIELLVSELGASVLASRDTATGEITCPNYSAGYHATEDWHRGKEEIAHLRIAHGLTVPDDISLVDRTKIHSNAHMHPQSGGFPHRHVPEDLSTF